MKNTLGLFVLLALLAALAGCSTPTSSGPFGKPGAGSNTVAAIPRLKPGLMLSVAVYVAGKKEHDEPDKRVSNEGNIALPLIGSVRVDQYTLDEVSRELEKRYAEYMVKPQVIVEFVGGASLQASSPWGYVMVMGRVRSPGRVPLPPTRDLTVSGALQAAGGLDTSASDTDIRVTRKADVRKINLRVIDKPGHLGEDLTLEAGDVIFVPEKLF